MSIAPVLGLPVLELRGNVNGYLAPYRVIIGGRERVVFGIKVGDFVNPVDVLPFEEEILESIHRYQEVFSNIVCDDGENYEYSEVLRLGREKIEFGTSVLDELILSELDVLGSFIDMIGMVPELKEFANYSRFYPAEVKNDLVVRLGPCVFLDVLRYNKGSLVALEFSYPSLGVLYRSAWDVALFEGKSKYIAPIVSLARAVIERCNAEFFAVPVVRV